ncbi:MAG: hypothetical protein LIO51_05690 [Clostridiales bacterium]|nr:hypothetical protein [Clostridiales bacterium]
MFCKKCGNKLVAGEKTCRYCGAPAEQAEICGGFWGLVGEKPSPAAAVPPVTPAPPVSPGPDQDPRYRRKLKQLTDRQTLLMVICAVLIVLTLVQAVQIGSLSSQVDALEADVAELETERAADDSSQEKSDGRTDAEQEEAEPKDAEQEDDGLSNENESPDADGQSAELSVKSSESEDVIFCFSEGGQCRVELPTAEDQDEESNSDDRYRFTYAYDGYELEIKNRRGGGRAADRFGGLRLCADPGGLREGMERR